MPIRSLSVAVRTYTITRDTTAPLLMLLLEVVRGRVSVAARGRRANIG